VFEFEADLSLSTDRLQTMEFRFYNISSDNVPPTTYTFNYENPNLPYINYVAMQNGAGSLRLSELTDNDITEQPFTLQVYTNDKAVRMNYYIGDYDSGTAPTGTVAMPSAVLNPSPGVTMHRFDIPIQNLPNGLHQITFVPRMAAP